jgi:phospholipid/cholesterol/gamma-HCH transport system substrate-binding protein
VIRRGVKMQLVAFLAITIVGISYASARYVGLGDLLLGSGYVVTADFPEAGGIFANAEVTYRGVAVGRVDRLRLADDGVHVDLRIDSGTRVPRDTIAVVENRSAVGEQYVDLQPRSSGGPFLAAGDRVDGPDNRTPLHTETLLLHLNRLVRSVDKGDLVTVIDELGDAFSGTGPDLQRLLDSGDALTRAATDNLEPTIKLIQDGRPVLDTQRDSGSAIKSFSADLAALSATLKHSDGDLRTVLDNGVVASHELDSLISTNRPAISALVTNLLVTGQVTVARLDGVEQILVTYPDNVAGGYTVVPGDGTSHFGLVLNASDPPACTQGYGGTAQRSPQETADVPANTDARCTLPRGSTSSVRGAQNAPSPSGRSGDVVPGGPASGSGTNRTYHDETDGFSQAVSSSYLAGYDPTSGLAYGTGGSPLRLRSTGGQAQTLGKDSWTWLLLGPMSR